LPQTDLTMAEERHFSRRWTLVGILGVAGAGGAIGVSQCSKRPAGTRQVSPAQPVKVEAGPTGFGRVSLAQVPIGGGGFVTGFDISADGTRSACRTDVANAYVRDASDPFWRPLFSPSSIGPKDLDPLPARKDKADSSGVAGIRLAPSNKDVIVATYLGYVWRSVDGGRSVQRTRLPQKRFLPNSGRQRLFNPTIDIHPGNPEEFIVGTWGEGAWSTADAGTTWRLLELPSAGQSHDNQPGVHLVLFDPAVPSRVYVFVTGLGLFRSDAGAGGKFELLPGGPTHSSNIVAGPGGSVFVCENAKDSPHGQVWRYSPQQGWSSARPEREALVLAIDPQRPTRALLIEANGLVMKSEDSCASFTSLGRPKWSPQGGEIRWMGGLDSLFPAQIRFDPRLPDRMWIAHGVGVASGDVRTADVVLEDRSAGIEELCAMSVLAVPGGKTFLSAWDKPFWRIDNLAAFTNDFRYPVPQGHKHTADTVVFSSYMDFAPEDPKFVVGVVAPSDGSAPGYTDDGGDTWRAFQGAPATGWGGGGCIAAASKTNFVLLPSNNAAGAFTMDGGRSWSPIKLDGQNPTSGFANAYYVARKNVTADKTRPGTFALVYTTIKNDTYSEPLGGLWVSRDGGRSWTQQLAGAIGPGNNNPRDVAASSQEARQFWQCQLDYVPGRPGELVYTPHADGPADRFFWSQDDGRTWAELHRSIRNVRAFGFGKAAPGQARPAIYFWGKVNDQPGLYASLDWFASPPQLVSRFPSQMLADISCVGGDPDRFGRAYVGTSCAGWVRVDIEL
jgi:hypothetical protein